MYLETNTSTTNTPASAVPALHGSSLHDQKLERVPLVFVDLETTGLVPSQGHRICEVALLRLQGGVVEAVCEHLVNPQRPLTDRAFAVNHISAEMLQDKPPFAAIADEVSEIVHGAVLVAHNAPFDAKFLAHEFHQIGRPEPFNLVLDTLALAQGLLTHPSYSLEALARDLNLPRPIHRAMSDVITLRGLFDYLTTVMAEQGITTVAEAIRCQRGWLPGEVEPVPPPLIAQALREKRRLRILYCSRTTPEALERLIEPLELIKKYGKVHLSAYCYLREDLRSFVLDKIEHAEME